MYSSVSPDLIIHYINDERSLSARMAPILQAAGFITRSHFSAEKLLVAQRSVLRGCYLLDVSYSEDACGFDLQAELIRRKDHMPVIFMTDRGSIQCSVRATKAGAFDFLTQDTSDEVLLATVTAALEEEARLWHSMRSGQDLRNRWETLTHRERQVFACVIAGMTNRQTGIKLGATERTVRAHRASVMEKMAVQSLAELVHRAQELELSMSLSPDE